jgi:hypothetical protein
MGFHVEYLIFVVVTYKLQTLPLVAEAERIV